MDNITAIIVACMGSNLLVEIFKAIFGRRNKLTAAVQAILRDRILYLCEKYIEKGSVYHKQFESLMSLYENYKALGGNGFIDEEVEMVKELPRYK